MSDYDYFSVGTDPEVDQQDFDKSSTIPRNSDISQSYRKMFQTKRPASTAGIPSGPGPVVVTPGVATIRRTPSTKPAVRRGGGGPIPIRTPVIPVKTPTVPELPGGFPCGLGGGVEEGEEPASPEGHASWSGQASTNPPLAPPHPEGAEDEDGPPPEGSDPLEAEGEDMLLTIRRGVRLKKTLTNDRSAPRIA